jgi:hypothetical protein
MSITCWSSSISLSVMATPFDNFVFVTFVPPQPLSSRHFAALAGAAWEDADEADAYGLAVAPLALLPAAAETDAAAVVADECCDDAGSGSDAVALYQHQHEGLIDVSERKSTALLRQGQAEAYDCLPACLSEKRVRTCRARR